ncbi:hypothetical protein [Paenibacillus sophorae]|nr:hypothetical protein [Paenibacillus sophorae]
MPKGGISCDVLIIGGGSSGAQCAHYLADSNTTLIHLDLYRPVRHVPALRFGGYDSRTLSLIMVEKERQGDGKIEAAL